MRTNVRDNIWFSQNEPENKFSLWLQYNKSIQDEGDRRLVLKVFDNGEWKYVGEKSYRGKDIVYVDQETETIGLKETDSKSVVSYDGKSQDWTELGNGLSFKKKIEVEIKYVDPKDFKSLSEDTIVVGSDGDGRIYLENRRSGDKFTLEPYSILHVDVKYQYWEFHQIPDDQQPVYLIIDNTAGIRVDYGVNVINMVHAAGGSYFVTMQFGTVKFEEINTI